MSQTQRKAGTAATAVMGCYRKMFRDCPLCPREQMLSQTNNKGHRLKRFLKKKKNAMKKFFKGLFGCCTKHGDDDTCKTYGLFHDEADVCTAVYMMQFDTWTCTANDWPDTPDDDTWPDQNNYMPTTWRDLLLKEKCFC